tara:strand:- start:3157 stop:3297 length:141 start_codon:yes stop_codon:yes gene_type:complete
MNKPIRLDSVQEAQLKTLEQKDPRYKRGLESKVKSDINNDYGALRK